MKAIIIGAGIAGLAAHLALRRIGVQVEQYERDAVAGPAGGAFAIWPNGFLALASLGIGPEVARRGTEIAGAKSFDGNGTLISYTDMTDMRRKFGEPPRLVTRHDLRQTLFSALGPGAVRFGANCVRVEQSGDTATAVFADGTESECDLLIGADGVRSMVRSHVAGVVPPQYVGIAYSIGIIANDGLIEPDKFVEYLSNRRRAHLNPLLDNRLYATFAGPMPENDSAPDRQAQLKTLYADWPQPVQVAIGRLKPELIHYWRVYDLPPLARWSAGCVTLLGDSAHATAPVLGQGVNQGIEDVIVLAEELESAGSLAAALERYEARRRDRVESVISESRRRVVEMHTGDREIVERYYRQLNGNSPIYGALDNYVGGGPANPAAAGR